MESDQFGLRRQAYDIVGTLKQVAYDIVGIAPVAFMVVKLTKTQLSRPPVDLALGLSCVPQNLLTFCQVSSVRYMSLSLLVYFE